MHARGYDNHAIMLLAAVKNLLETRNFDGAVVVVFSPQKKVAAARVKRAKTI